MTFFRLIPAALFLLIFTACGLAEDPRDEDNKYIYIENKIPDPQFLAFCLREYDSSGDSRLSLYEAQRVLRMNCAGLDIASLQGIWEFSRLQRLDCSNNELQSLDLSRCPAIENLVCSNNKLTRIDIGELFSLTVLQCGKNDLPTLSLPASSSLVVIECDDNDLSILDITHCALNITRLYARGNPRLDVIYKTAEQYIAQLSIDGHTIIQDR